MGASESTYVVFLESGEIVKRYKSKNIPPQVGDTITLEIKAVATSLEVLAVTKMFSDLMAVIVMTVKPTRASH